MAIADETATASESPIFYPSEDFKENAHITSMDQYRRMYKRSIECPEEFWGEIAEEFYFKSGPRDRFLRYNMDLTRGPIEIKWMEGAETNVCYNVVDRVIEKGMGDRVAYIW